MAKKPPVRVALDLETTGLHAEQDAILEVAAIKFQGDEVLDTFESFVAPGRSIPYRVQRLTNISAGLLTDAPLFEAIAPALQNFLGDLPIVGHSIPFDVGFLRKRGLAYNNPLIDTFELASVLLPSLKSYNLGQVAEALDIHVPEGRHRAMVDTVLAKDVFLALHHRLQTIDSTLLKDLANLDAPRSWPLLGFFRQELRNRQEQEGMQVARGSLGDLFAAQLGVDPRILTFAIASKSDPKSAPPSVMPVVDNTDSSPPEQVQTSIAVIPEQASVGEPKGYQTAQAAVQAAFEQCTPLFLEVTIGRNDYTPALLSALEWLALPAQEGGQPKRLVIACGNQQHARRLLDVILPSLQTRLPRPLSVAYWAERGGYLCPHRWFGVALRRTSGELSAEQARGLAKVGLWAQQTLTGERGELTMLQQETAAWERISSGVERIASSDKRSGTMYDRCIYRKRGYCFLSRAEERVADAQVIVTTHMGLFDDLSGPHSLLASVAYRLILDTDMLEEENARWSSADLDLTRLLTIINTIGTELPNGRYQGLLALAAPSLRDRGPGGLSSTSTIAKSELDTRLLTWFQALRQARAAVEKLFTTYHRLIEEFAQQGHNGREKAKGSEATGREKGKGEGSGRSHAGTRATERADMPMRFTGQTRTLSSWSDAERTWQQAAARLQAVIDIAYEAEKTILTTQRSRHRLDAGGGEDSSVAAEFVAAAQQLLEQKKLGQQAMTLSDGDIVYWLRMPQIPYPQANARSGENIEEIQTPVLYSQLVQSSVFIKRHLMKERSSTIFVGAALSVDNSFSYYRGRFGLENETCPAFTIVTEHHEQTLLYLPNDVPEPNMPQYQRHLEESLIQLVTTLKGQTVVLFTSHAALRSSYFAVKQVLESRGILVLGQGMDGSPRQLWQIVKEQEHVVLLATSSFWDTVEEMQFSPTCIVLTRLPMPVLNDPPIAARVEHYSDQLHQLTVPVAALRMRRILNRLAWNQDKRNAIVLFDRRVTSKEYGGMILHSLPRCSQRQSPVSHMSESILEWLSGTGAWEDA